MSTLEPCNDPSSPSSPWISIYRNERVFFRGGLFAWNAYLEFKLLPDQVELIHTIHRWKKKVVSHYRFCKCLISPDMFYLLQDRVQVKNRVLLTYIDKSFSFFTFQSCQGSKVSTRACGWWTVFYLTIPCPQSKRCKLATPPLLSCKMFKRTNLTLPITPHTMRRTAFIPFVSL